MGFNSAFKGLNIRSVDGLAEIVQAVFTKVGPDTINLANFTS